MWEEHLEQDLHIRTLQYIGHRKPTQTERWVPVISRQGYHFSQATKSLQPSHEQTLVSLTELVDAENPRVGCLGSI